MTSTLLIYSVALFGSELEQRAEYERVNIPGIVMRCIQEVDARGKLFQLGIAPVLLI